MRDIVHNIKAVIAAPHATRSANFNGDPVDLKDFDSVALVVATTAVNGDGNMTVKLQESDTTTSGDFTDVAPEHVQGEIADPLTANGTTKLGYRGFKRYLRAVLTLNSGTSVGVGALWILGNASERPVA